MFRAAKYPFDDSLRRRGTVVRDKVVNGFEIGQRPIVEDKLQRGTRRAGGCARAPLRARPAAVRRGGGDSASCSSVNAGRADAPENPAAQRRRRPVRLRHCFELPQRVFKQLCHGSNIACRTGGARAGSSPTVHPLETDLQHAQQSLGTSGSISPGVPRREGSPAAAKTGTMRPQPLSRATTMLRKLIGAAAIIALFAGAARAQYTGPLPNSGFGDDRFGIECVAAADARADAGGCRARTRHRAAIPGDAAHQDSRPQAIVQRSMAKDSPGSGGGAGGPAPGGIAGRPAARPNAAGRIKPGRTKPDVTTFAFTP